MDMILTGIVDALTFSNIVFIMLGVMLGILVGAIPGLNGPMAITLAVPITYFMSPVTAIAFLIGINKGGSFGGSIAAVLLNTPGAPEAAATCFDGYPLAKQGKGIKAIKVALYSSVFGDGFSTLLVIFVAAPVASVALRLGPPEVCSIIIFSLTLIAALESDSLAKGVLSAAGGMLLSTVGMDPVTSLPRLTLDFYQLDSGFSVATIGVGLLALSELIVQGEEMKTSGRAVRVEEPRAPEGSDRKVTLREFLRTVPTLFRSSSIGCFVGMLPGLGATIAAFLAYGVAKKFSKNPETFGTGNLIGVAAPESANNAVGGSALIPLFSLGIPGNIASAILIGAFILHGITPGPLMFAEHGRTVYAIYGSMIIGNILNLACGYIGLSFFVKILSAPRAILYPILISICISGAYIADGSLFAVGTMITFAFLGYFIKKLRFSFVSLIIGFVLGPLFELSLQQTLIMSEMDITIMLRRPVSCIFIIITVLSIIRITWKKMRRTPGVNPHLSQQTDLS